MHSILGFLLLSSIICGPMTQGARILAVVPIFSMSHHMIIQPILRALAEAGHNLVVYSPFPLSKPHPNYTDVFMDTISTDNSNLNEIFTELIDNPYWRCLDNMLPLHDLFINGTLENEQIKALLRSNENFDLVITETFVAQEFSLLFGYRFDAPTIDLHKNISLMFINDHWTADYAQPRPPNMIPVAGIHIEPEKPLPRDLQQYMDGAKNGVILMSLGTLVPDDSRPESFFASFANVFRKLPQRVIWKTRKTSIEGLPENVKLVQWMPQRDVLAHPKCVLFITHGGLASQHETIYTGVPVIGIPYFADQHRNVGFYVAQEVGLRIMPNDVSEESVGSAVRTILEDNKYRDNMKRLSSVFRDSPLTPKQAVVFWTEYVIRHRGAPHLTPALADLTWYQRTLLDVLVLILFSVISVIYVLYILGRKIYSSLTSRKNVNEYSYKKSN